MRYSTHLALLAFALLSSSLGHAATIIDFEDWSPGPGYPLLVESRGFDFHGDLSVSVDAASGNPTNALHSRSSGFKMGMGGRTFGVVSLDLQEGLGSSDTASIRLWAYLPSPAGMVEQTLVLDGRADTYETFYPTGFSGIDTLFFDTYDNQGQPVAGQFSVDNIVVPEPGALSLVAIAFVGASRRRETPL